MLRRLPRALVPDAIVILAAMPKTATGKIDHRNLPASAFDGSADDDGMKQFDGTPREVLESPELLALILPILRNDLKLLETYTFDAGRAPLGMPFYISGGDVDGLVPVESLSGWSKLSAALTTIRVWSGGIFIWPSEKASTWRR